MSTKLYTEEEVRAIAVKAILTENWEIERYKYPDESVYDINEEEFENWFSKIKK